MEHNSDKIEHLVQKYMDYWDQGDTEGLMSMYHPDMLYHDMQSGETVDGSHIMQFLLDIFAHKSDRRMKLKKSVVFEGNSAFIYWHHSFFATNQGKQVVIHGVELMVFRDDKIFSIHEFYDFRSAESEPTANIGKGTHQERMTKLGLTESMMRQLSDDLTGYFEKDRPYLQPDLTLSKVSADLGYTRNQISFVINHGMHRTFYDLVNARRIDHAIRQMSLPDSNVSILELGLDAGFSSVSGFYNAFRKQTDMTPAQYKRSLQDIEA